MQALLVEFDSSDQSASGFARARGIAVWRMYHALQRRSGKVRSRIPAARASSNALLAVRVVSAKPASAPASLELILAGGQRVVIGPDFDACLLRRVLEALAPC